jgi:RNA polymerase sigma-70 factor (ECF subfamily)
MVRCPDDTEALLDRVAEGQASAAEELLARHRGRLASMIRFRMDRRLAARLDPSDVVQEAFVEAYGKLLKFAQTRPMPFYPWLRSIAWERLIQLHRQHLRAQRRTVNREETLLPLPDESEAILAERFAASASGASRQAVRREVRERVHTTLDRLPTAAREVIVLRHLEELPFKDIADVLGVSEVAVYSRYRRAAEQLSRLLKSPEV